MITYFTTIKKQIITTYVNLAPFGVRVSFNCVEGNWSIWSGQFKVWKIGTCCFPG